MNNLNISEYEEFFKTELDELQNELHETDSFYNEIKQHFDSVKKSYSSGSLTFISKQTPNLVAIKKNKIDILKDIVTIKKTILDAANKNKDTNDSGADDNIVRMLHTLLLTNNRDEYIKSYQQNENKEEQTTEDINYDDLINSRINELSENEKNDEIDNKNSICETQQDYVNYKGYFFGTDVSGELYPLDSEYNILENIPKSEYPNWDLSIYEDENGEIYAMNQYDEVIEVLEFEDDE